ncbi:NEDD8 ligase DCN1 SCDLUD_001763 [Saccharomycodes ludwigii]|uniref:NEDD8 ligase DCN1 n=1 Tax=Saccharomycodes ludwigii TaxID=36035 RepID=UPI001E8A65DE|nr:hypothetical protein SCDLUD_001763 [Saccharomycodes ludwigii]KAH3901975.1 hypothetical protein SCDLUD_001763 [Saccharomycodes ludwigii]
MKEACDDLDENKVPINEQLKKLLFDTLLSCSTIGILRQRELLLFQEVGIKLNHHDDLFVKLCVIYEFKDKNIETNSITEKTILEVCDKNHWYTLNDFKNSIKYLVEIKLHKDFKYLFEIYKLSFKLYVNLENDNENKNILDYEMAENLWNALLLSYKNHIVMNRWFEFYRKRLDNIDSSSNKSSINKHIGINYDLWVMFYKFISKYPTIELIKSGYNHIESWPLIIDDFVETL